MVFKYQLFVRGIIRSRENTIELVFRRLAKPTCCLQTRHIPSIFGGLRKIAILVEELLLSAFAYFDPCVVCYCARAGPRESSKR